MLCAGVNAFCWWQLMQGGWTVFPSSTNLMLPSCNAQVRSRPYGASPADALSQRVAQAETAAAEAHRALHIANSSAAEAAR